MMEKSLILKHIIGKLCLLDSYNKFTRPLTRNSFDYSLFVGYNING